MTPEAKKKLYQQLSQPFPEEAIERTDGRVTGKGYSTTGIKAQFIINRLRQGVVTLLVDLAVPLPVLVDPADPPHPVVLPRPGHVPPLRDGKPHDPSSFRQDRRRLEVKRPWPEGGPRKTERAPR